jgi:hypothetical protein
MITEDQEVDILFHHQGGRSSRWIAGRVGVSRNAVDDVISHGMIRRLWKKSRSIYFADVEKYICPTCKNKISLRPCPVCLALEEAEKTRQRGAVENESCNPGDDQSKL